LTVVSEAIPGAATEGSLDGYRILRPGGPVGVHLWTLSRFSRNQRDVEFDVLIHDFAKIMPWTLPLTRHPVHAIGFVHHIFGRNLLGELSLPQGALAVFMERADPWLHKHRHMHCVTETNYTKSIMVKLGWPKDRIWVIPPGIDHSQFWADSSERSPTPLVIYVGRLREYKRVDLAIGAVQLLIPEYPELRLEIVGDGPDMPRLRRVVKERRMESRVTFSGRVLDGELGPLYRRAWASLQPSVVEGWGFTTLEAAACGTPTVAFRNSVFPETVGPQSEKYLAVDGDVADYAKKLSMCMDDQRSQTSGSLAGQTEYARRFNWESTAASWLTMLHQVHGG
jgi:glycosyltransferase involved in cell wall biosynthesis